MRLPIVVEAGSKLDPQHPAPGDEGVEAKVFCFFFSKKKTSLVCF
jgi:hypothetical protein